MPIPVTRTGKIATLSLLIGLPGYLLERLEMPWTPATGSITLLLTALGLALYYVSLLQYVRAAVVKLQQRRRAQSG